MRPSLEKLKAQLVLKLADLHGKCWLAHRTAFGRAAEVASFGESLEISKLAQGDRHKKNISVFEEMKIRAYHMDLQ